MRLPCQMFFECLRNSEQCLKGSVTVFRVILSIDKITFKLKETWKWHFTKIEKNIKRMTINHKRTRMVKDGEDWNGLQTMKLKSLAKLFKPFNRNWAPLTLRRNYSTHTKIPRNEAKIYQKSDFLSSEGYLLTSPGCCLTLASSLDVVQVRFASWTFFTAFLEEQPF